MDPGLPDLPPDGFGHRPKRKSQTSHYVPDRRVLTRILVLTLVVASLVYLLTGR